MILPVPVRVNLFLEPELVFIFGILLVFKLLNYMATHYTCGVTHFVSLRFCLSAGAAFGASAGFGAAGFFGAAPFFGES